MRQEVSYKADWKMETWQIHTKQSQEKQDKINTEQNMAWAISHATIEVAKAEIMAVRAADNTVNNSRPIYTMPRVGDPALRQPAFDWKVADKYQVL